MIKKINYDKWEARIRKYVKAETKHDNGMIVYTDTKDKTYNNGLIYA